MPPRAYSNGQQIQLSNEIMARLLDEVWGERDETDAGIQLIEPYETRILPDA